MAFSHTGSTSNGGNSAEASTGTHGLTINEGDLVVAFVHINGTATLASDDGLTEEDDRSVLDETARVGFYWKVAGGSEPTAYTWTIGSSSYWRVCFGVFTSSTDAEIATALNYFRKTNNTTDLECGAARSQSANDGDLGIITGGKDNRATTNEAYTTADNSYTGATGGTSNQIAGMAHRVYNANKTYGASEDIDIDVADGHDGRSDKTFGYYITFQESAGSDNDIGELPAGMLTYTGLAGSGVSTENKTGELPAGNLVYTGLALQGVNADSDVGELPVGSIVYTAGEHRPPRPRST